MYQNVWIMYQNGWRMLHLVESRHEHDNRIEKPEHGGWNEYFEKKNVSSSNTLARPRTVVVKISNAYITIATMIHISWFFYHASVTITNFICIKECFSLNK